MIGFGLGRDFDEIEFIRQLRAPGCDRPHSPPQDGIRKRLISACRRTASSTKSVDRSQRQFLQRADGCEQSLGPQGIHDQRHSHRQG
jgi:hypothetical protein